MAVATKMCLVNAKPDEWDLQCEKQTVRHACVCQNTRQSLVNQQGSAASAAAPILRHVTAGFTGGGQVFVTGSTPTASAAGDIWIDTAGTSGYTQSLSSNGWTRLPNGVILQWGTVSAPPNTTSNAGTFPTSFTTVARAVMNGIGDFTTGQASKGATIWNVSTTGFTFFNGDENTATGFWLAMGY
jgi:hypothetical protein